MQGRCGHRPLQGIKNVVGADDHIRPCESLLGEILTNTRYMI